MPGNPAFNEKTFDQFQDMAGAADSERMTLEGTINKGIILLGLAVLCAAVSWTTARINPALGMTLLIVGAIGAFVVGLVTRFKPQTARITAPLYAILEGLALGAISSVFEAKYQGIVLNAVLITCTLLMLMFLAYRARIIRATPVLVKVVGSAMIAIAVAYGLEFIAGMFGVRDLLSLNSGGPLSIGISLFVIVIACLNFVLIFNMLEQGVEKGAPKFMEWYAAFGIMVTLFWLYLEVLRLLANMQRRN